MKDFSIIFPTRDREELLLNLLRSISINTYNLDSIEVLVAIDDDDPYMRDFVLRSSFTFVKFFPVKRSLNFSRDYYTYLAKQSTGRWIIACNDDCEFLTKGWDKTAKTILEQYIKTGPNFVYGWAEDMLGEHRLTQFGNYCCFPLIGREGFNALGYFFPEDIPTWGADIWIEKLYRNIGRCVKLPITIKHISHHNKLREQDGISKRISMNQVSCDMNPRYEQINKLIDAIVASRNQTTNV